jgi:endoglycosylceramidase
LRPVLPLRPARAEDYLNFGAVIKSAGRWLTDEHGRVVVLHGVNMVNKLPPYDPAAVGFGAADAAFLAAEGFNTVRLGIIWKALEPEPGSYDDAYLDRIAGTVAELGLAGIAVLLDFHQDMLNERFNGEGFPDWAIQDEGLRPWPDIGFPGNYIVMRALWRAYDHFWANDPGPGGVGLQDRYAAAWRHVAERFLDEPAVFAYDIFNEPFPGSVAIRCLRPDGSRRFDRALSAFSRRVLTAIREVDRGRLVFYEPNVLFDYGADTHHDDLDDPAVGLSFHVYCVAASPGMPRLPARVQDPICERQEQRVFDLAERHSRRTGAALLLSEFGATDDLRKLDQTVALADRNMASWQYWAYFGRDPCCERPEEGLVHDVATLPEGANVKQDKLDVLARPYPRSVAGTPLQWSFDRAGRWFELEYVTRSPGGEAREKGDETEIFLPHRHFPGTYEVEVDGAAVTSAPGEPILRIASAGASRVSVRVSPAGIM